MKYGDLNLGQIEALANRLGGMEGINALLASSGIDVKRALALQGAATRNGWSDTDISRFSEGDAAKLVLPIVRGYGRVELMKILMDLAAPATLPKERSAADGWTIEEHIPGPVDFEYRLDAFRLLTIPEQESGYIEGNKLRKKLKGEPVLNANALDFFLSNPHLIPEDWKGKFVFFWGTIYRYRDDDLCVRCLYWSGGRWRWSDGWLGGSFLAGGPAVVSAS